MSHSDTDDFDPADMMDDDDCHPFNDDDDDHPLSDEHEYVDSDDHLHDHDGGFLCFSCASLISPDLIGCPLSLFLSLTLHLHLHLPLYHLRTNAEMDLAFHPIQESSSKKKTYEIDFSTHSTQDMMDTQSKEVQHVETLCGLSAAQSACLLRHFRWNKERLLEHFMEDSVKVLAEAGIQMDAPTPSFTKAPAGFMCDICCMDDEGRKIMVVKVICHRVQIWRS